VATFSDITLIRESHERMEFLATHDELTGLPNRSLYIDRLRHALARLERSDRLLAILFIDLDNFKTVNDTLGHHYGDQLLIEAAERLKSCVRVADTVARLGGDEFTFLLEDIEKHEASLAASRVLEAFAKPFRIANRDVFVGCSIGIAIYPDDGPDTATLLRNADTAMYRAKESGKNAFQFFTTDMAGAASQRLELESALRHALEKDELFLHYQPQLDLRGRQIVGVEALLRWRRANGSYIAPGEFIPIAEQSTLIITLSQWLINQICRQILIWDHIKLPPLRVAFNVAARHFRHAQILATLHESVGRYAIDPAQTSARLPFSSSQFLRSPARFFASSMSISAKVSSPASSVSCTRRRVAGSMVVSRSCSGFISPRPLKRVTLTLPFFFSARCGRECPVSPPRPARRTLPCRHRPGTAAAWRRGHGRLRPAGGNGARTARTAAWRYAARRNRRRPECTPCRNAVRLNRSEPGSTPMATAMSCTSCEAITSAESTSQVLRILPRNGITA
jgi:diguanylate cyclase (GGDEF)-like protein